MHIKKVSLGILIAVCLAFPLFIKVLFTQQIVNDIYFLLNGNIVLSYFFALINAVFIYASGYLFLTKFMEKPRKQSLIVASYFLLNPIYIGNFSNVGLIFAASLLPVNLVYIKEYFKTFKLPYLIFVILLLNLSLVHPFTFVFNVIITVIFYSIYKVHKLHKILTTTKHTVVALLTALLLNLYFILSVFQLGLFGNTDIAKEGGVGDKFLFNVRNSSSILEAITNSKEIFLELHFFTALKEPLYYFVFASIYLLLIFGMIELYKKLSGFDKKILFTCLLVPIIVYLFSKGESVSSINAIYEVIKNTPGGWMLFATEFWQLYEPLLIIVVLGTLFKYLKVGRSEVRIVFDAILIILMLSNAVLLGDIFFRAVAPTDEVVEISNIDFDETITALQNDDECKDATKKDPNYFDLVHHQISKDARIFEVIDNPAVHDNQTFLKNFDLILICGDVEDEYNENFETVIDLDDPNYAVLRNIEPFDEVSLDENLARINNYQFEERFVDGQPINSLQVEPVEVDFPLLYQVDDESTRPNITTLENTELMYSLDEQGNFSLFYRHNGDLYIDGELIVESQPRNLFSSTLQYNMIIVNDENYELYLGTHSLGVFDPRDIRVIIETTEGFYENKFVLNELIFDDLTFDKSVEILGEKTENIFQNASFENGSWQQTVGDCYDHDDAPVLGMALSDDYATDGEKSLKMFAKRHIACVSQLVDVEPNYNLRLSLDAYAKDSNFLYHFQFKNEEVDEFLEKYTITGREKITKVIKTPQDAVQARLFIKVPKSDNVKTNTVWLDNFEGHIYQDLTGMYDYENLREFTEKSVVEYDKVNSSRYDVKVTGYGQTSLVLKQGYNADWRLFADGQEIGNKFIAYDLYNGWVIDINDLCEEIENACVAREDGNYEIDMQIRYTQSAVYSIGEWISAAVFLAIIIYLVWEWHLNIEHPKKKEVKKSITKKSTKKKTSKKVTSNSASSKKSTTKKSKKKQPPKRKNSTH